MIVAAVIVALTWSSFVLVTASYCDRAVRRPQVLTIVVAVIGLTLAVPVVVLGSYGLPADWSVRWLELAARLGRVGLWLMIAGAAAWVWLDTGFVWRERRRVFWFTFGSRRDKP